MTGVERLAESLVIRAFPTNDFAFIMILSLDLPAFPDCSRLPGFEPSLNESIEYPPCLGNLATKSLSGLGRYKPDQRTQEVF
jgi:hypothetical protein